MRSTRSILVAALFLAVVRSPLAAQPTPSCPGDCNLDGAVTIDEILRGVNFLLAGQPPAGCDELDDDRDGAVAVNEIVRAVVKALIGCRLTGDAAAEAAAGVAIGIVDSAGVIDLGSAAAGAPGSGAGATLAALGAAAGQSPPCAAGGAMEESCNSDRDSSRLTVTYFDCRVAAGDRLLLVLDGRLERTVDDGAYCATRQLRDGARVTEALTAFRQAFLDGDVTLLEFAGTYTRELVPGAAGCAGRAASERFDGELTQRCDPGQETTVCPPEGRDLTVVARDLAVVRDSAGGQAGPCIRTRTLLGRLELRDRVAGRAFDAVYRQFIVRDQLGTAPQPPLELQGAAAFDCLGELSVVTEIPLARPAAARCPTSGLLFVRFPDRVERAVRYLRGGVEIDLDGDGRPDLGAESCADAALTQCE